MTDSTTEVEVLGERELPADQHPQHEPELPHEVRGGELEDERGGGARAWTMAEMKTPSTSDLPAMRRAFPEAVAELGDPPSQVAGRPDWDRRPQNWSFGEGRGAEPP